MSNENVLNQIKSVCGTEDLIIEYDYKDSNKYFATIRTKMEEEVEYSKWCDDWIKKFSIASASEWIVRYTYPSAKRYIYRKVFKCQHNSFDKVKQRKRTDSRVRDKGCNATVNILMKKINSDTIKNDPYLERKLNIVITVNFDHTHNIMVAEAFSYLRMTLDTQKMFLEYFDNGMTPSAARTYHEMLLETQYEGPDFFINLSNAQINPTERQINHLYNKWRSANFETREEKSILEMLRQKGESIIIYNNLCAIQQKLGIVLKAAPILTLEDKKDLAKIALGDDISRDFFKSMDDCVQRHNESEPLHMAENMEFTDSSRLDNIPNSSNMYDEEHSSAVAGLVQQFQRITNIAANCNSVDLTNTVIKLTRALKGIETPANLLHFFHAIPTSRKRQIGVQPTSISRRKIRPGLTSGAKKVQAGRPSKHESISQKKRQRCLQANPKLK